MVHGQGPVWKLTPGKIIVSLCVFIWLRFMAGFEVRLLRFINGVDNYF